MTTNFLAQCLAGASLLACFSFVATAEDKAPNWPVEIRQRNAEMKRRVDLWLKGRPEKRTPVHVVYLSCEDQKPFPNHRQRLDRVLTEIQNWIANQTKAAGFGRVTMTLDRDRDGMVKLHEGKLPFKVRSRNVKNKVYTHRECVKATKAILEKSAINYDRGFVLVLTTIPDDRGAAPFFGNMIQDRGYCFAVDTPWLDSEYTKTDGPKVWKGQPVGPANSALIGGIAHELGHGFGLPHCDESPAQKNAYGESLMASGNYTWRQERRNKGKGSFLLDGDAMFLIARPPFTSRVRDFERRPKVTIDQLRYESQKDGRIRVTGRIRTDIPVYAVKVYDDPPGNGDYNAVAHATLPDNKTGEFRLNFAPIRKKGQHELRLYLYHVNGRWTMQKHRIDVRR